MQNYCLSSHLLVLHGRQRLHRLNISKLGTGRFLGLGALLLLLHGGKSYLGHPSQWAQNLRVGGHGTSA
jgi:hypothetical protein